MAVVQKEVALDALKRILPPNQVITSRVALLTYEVDGAMDRGTADGVALVQSADDVVRIMKWADEYGVPVVARGAGTGLSGGCVAEHGGVVVGFSRMNRILEFDDVGRSVVVEPGVVNLALDEVVKAKGLYFPPDPASGRTSTLGGNIAENAGGPHCFKYGVTTNYISGLEVVLADGRRVKLGGRALDYPEYDLVGLLTGNEGTLAIITQATGRLIRNPLAVKTALAAFNTIEDAGQAVSGVIAAGLVPATIEMMDQKCMRIIEDASHAGLPVEAGAGLIIETDGYPESVSPQMDEIAEILRQYRVCELRIAQTAAERDQIWYGRKGAAGAFARMAPAYLTLDGTVPRSKLAETLTAIARVGDELGILLGFVFHAGDGNLHPDIFFDPEVPGTWDKVNTAWDRIMEMCVQAGGSITGEHGVGIEKRKYMHLMFNSDELWALQDVKDVFDPKQLLNPGKILPADLPAKAVRPAPTMAIGDAFSPVNAVETAEALRAWAAAEKPQTVRVKGGGTKSVLQPPADATLSTDKMRGIEECAIGDLYVTVRAGTPLSELQAELSKSGVWVPLISPWDASTVGGIVSANFNVPLRMRYGALRDLVLTMTVALPDGRVLRTGRPVVKNVAGYDIQKLFIGSQGTLGVIAGVTLKLAPLPRYRTTLVVPVDRLERGLQGGLKSLRLAMVASSVVLARGADVPGVSAPFALVYTSEGIREDVEAELLQVTELLNAEGMRVPKPDTSAASGSELWATWMRNYTPAGPVLRAGVPARDLPALVNGVVAKVAGAPFVVDIASGLLYLQNAEVDAVRQLARSTGGYAVVLSGTNGNVDRWGHEAQALDLVRALKERWDPKGVLNPGAFLL